MKCPKPGVVVFRGNAWECAECGSIDCAKDSEKEKKSSISSYGPRVCECGALKTLNPDCHSFWCPLYKK